MGLELALFDKIEVNVDAYKDKRTNILQGRGIIPATLGKEADIIANVGEAERYGVDGDVRYNQAFANSLWIQVQGNFTFAKSRYLYLKKPNAPGCRGELIKENLSMHTGDLLPNGFLSINMISIIPLNKISAAAGDARRYQI